jgi:hypothetical protein
MDNPDEDLLRPLAKTPALQAELERAADLIARLRNYGTAQMRTLMESQEGSVANDVAIPLIVAIGIQRWGLALLSAIEQQIRDGWTGPAKITIRSLFECMLAAKYMLADPAQRYNRARAYMYGELLKSHSFLMGRLPDTPAGKKAAALATQDEFGPALLSTLPEARIRERLAEVEREMSSTYMIDIATEFERLRRSKRPNVAWHELFDGPRNVEQLAVRTGHALSYEVLYRLWSQSAHATAVVRPAVRIQSGKVDIMDIRCPTDLNEAKVTAFNFGRGLYQAIAALLPNYSDREFAAWYSEQRSDFMRRVQFIDANNPTSY